MSDPNWKAFSQTTWTAEVFRVLEVLDMLESIPAHGRPQSFRADEDSTWRTVFIGEGGVFVLHCLNSVWTVGSGDEVLSVVKLRKGLTNEKALKAWLRLWGWTPPSKAPAAEPAPPPMVV
jgi:hypothetical protein